MPVGLRREVLATESQPFRPTPSAYTCSLQVHLSVDFHEVDAQVLDRNDRVGWDRTVVFDEPAEATADEVLDGLISASPAVAAHDAVVEGGAAGDEARWVFSYQDDVGSAFLHRFAGSALERRGGRFAPGVACAGGTDKRPRLLLPFPLGGVDRPYGARLYTVSTVGRQQGSSISKWVGQPEE